MTLDSWGDHGAPRHCPWNHSAQARLAEGRHHPCTRPQPMTLYTHAHTRPHMRTLQHIHTCSHPGERGQARGVLLGGWTLCRNAARPKLPAFQESKAGPALKVPHHTQTPTVPGRQGAPRGCGAGGPMAGAQMPPSVWTMRRAALAGTPRAGVWAPGSKGRQAEGGDLPRALPPGPAGLGRLWACAAGGCFALPRSSQHLCPLLGFSHGSSARHRRARAGVPQQPARG